MAEPPTGTVTFLFTDIEGSTRLWEQHPEAMRAALSRHDALLAAGVRKHEGQVIKSRGEGDSLFAVFARATDALAAAADLQQALLAEPWPTADPLRVRMALHTGEAELREGDYFGPAVNRCARLRAAAHGSQVLLSLATQELVRDALPAGVSLKDLGLCRLRDLQRPETVFQLLHPDLPAEFPALRSLDTLPHNLPQPLTSFIGREPEIVALKQLLAGARLLTLTGSGGTGKSRLSLQVAADLLDEYADGVWLVELAALADPALVPQAVATALGVREEPGKPLTQTLVDSLKAKRLLLILDNCEHLLAACAALVEGLLRSCPNIRVMASSREGLNIAGEQTYRVPSLSVPDPRQLPPSLESLTQYEAVRLFIDRAVLHQPSFAVTNQNAPAVAQLCHRLDGIPLAIELAAARAKALPVEKLNERLDDMFRLLTGGSRTALPRQQTLRALIDWSYDLLAQPEKALLRCLSVFAGGWTLEAAEAVCVGEGVEEWEVLDLLTSLVEKSLVLYEERGGKERYHLLETVRQYARDRLLEAGYPAKLGEAEVVRERHRDWFLGLAEQAVPELEGALQREWLERLEVEHDNLRAALAWSGAHAEGEAGLRLGGALWRFWEMRGYVREGRERLAGLLALPGGAPPTQRSGGPARTAARAGVLDGAGVLAQNQGDHGAARALFEESLAISRELGNTRGIAWSLQSLGWSARERGDYGVARPLIEESLALFRKLEYKRGIAWSLYNLGLVARDQGDHEALWTLFEERLAICRELGDKRGIAESLVGLAQVAQARSDPEKARTLLDEAHAVGQGTEACMEQGHVLLDMGDYPTARSRYEEGLALRRARRAGERWIACALLEVGHAAWLQGESVIAQSHALEALVLFQELSDNEGVLAALDSLGAAALAQGPGGGREERPQGARSGGAGGVPGYPPQVGERVLGAAGGERAARLLGAAAALRAALGVPGASWWRRPRERIGEAARAVSLDPEFAAAWAEGRAMSFDQAICAALAQEEIPTTGRQGSEGDPGVTEPT